MNTMQDQNEINSVISEQANSSFEQRVLKCADILRSWYNSNANHTEAIDRIVAKLEINLKQPKDALVKAVAAKCILRDNNDEDGVEWLLQEISSLSSLNPMINENPLEIYQGQENVILELKKKIYESSAMHSHFILASLEETLESAGALLLSKRKKRYLKFSILNLVELNYRVFESILRKI